MPAGDSRPLERDASGLYSFIGSMARHGMGADRIYRFQADEGLGLTRAVVRTIVGEIRDEVRIRRALPNLDPRNPIPDRAVAKNSSLKTNEYLHTVSMFIRDQVTGYRVQQYFTYRTPEPVTPDEVYGAAADSVDEGQSFEGFVIDSMVLVSVSHN